MRGQSEPQLDVATLRAEVDPRNLLEEVHAQLRIGGAWMSEPGIAQRCRLARSRNEVIGALIELKRQGCAEEGEPQGGRPLWRTVLDKAPETTLRGALTLISHDAEARAAGRAPNGDPETIVPAPAAHKQRPVQSPTAETIAPRTHTEDPVMLKKTARVDRTTPIVEALRAGPMSAEELSKATGFAMKPVSQALTRLKASGAVRLDKALFPFKWSLAHGAAVAPAGSNKNRGTQPVAPPRGPSSPLVSGSNGLRWFLGSDGSVRLEHSGAVIELQAHQFDTLKRAHAVVKAAETEA